MHPCIQLILLGLVALWSFLPTQDAIDAKNVLESIMTEQVPIKDCVEEFAKLEHKNHIWRAIRFAILLGCFALLNFYVSR